MYFIDIWKVAHKQILEVSIMHRKLKDQFSLQAKVQSNFRRYIRMSSHDFFFLSVGAWYWSDMYMCYDGSYNPTAVSLKFLELTWQKLVLADRFRHSALEGDGDGKCVWIHSLGVLTLKNSKQHSTIKIFKLILVFKTAGLSFFSVNILGNKMGYKETTNYLQADA